MLSLFAFLLPPVLLCVLWNRWISPIGSWKQYVIIYALATLGLNGACLGALVYIFHNNDKLIEKLNYYNVFTFKYIMLSVFLIVLFCGMVIRYRRFIGRVKISISDKLIQSNKFWKTLAIIYALVLLCFNFVRIFDMNYCSDEAYTISLAHMNITNMLDATARDVHPPLYYIIVQIFSYFFGFNGISYHFASLVPYIGILFVALTKIWKQLGKIPALILITCASLLPTAVHFNVFIRMYSWAAFFVLLSYLELRKILLCGTNKDYLFFVLFSLGAAYTHYYALVSVAFFYIALLILGFFDRKKTRAILIACVATVIGYLPWLFVLLKTFNRVSNSFHIKRIPTFIECIAYYFEGAYPFVLFGIMFVTIAISLLYDFSIIKIENDKGEKCVSICVDLPSTKLSKEGGWMLAGLLGVLGTAVVAIGVSVIFRPLLAERYLYPVAIVAWLLLGVGISKCRGKNVYAVIVLIMLLFSCVPQWYTTYTTERRENDTLKKTLEATANEIQAGDIILSDCVHICWTIAGSYYPNTTSILIDRSDIPVFEEDTQYWFILIEKLDDAMGEALEDMGYTYSEIVKYGQLGGWNVFVYKLEYSVPVD